MFERDYKRALEAAAREYEALGQQRQELDKRLAEVAQTISTLSRLCGLVPTVPWGLTDACRVVLRGAGQPMAPVDVRERLAAIGFGLSKYASNLAAIHTVLKRLYEAGEVRAVAHTVGRQAYVWNHVSTDGLSPAVVDFMRARELEAGETSAKPSK